MVSVVGSVCSGMREAMPGMASKGGNSRVRLTKLFDPTPMTKSISLLEYTELFARSR